MSTETREQQEFREYCRCWLKDNHPGQPPVPLPVTATNLDQPEQLA